MPRWRCRCREGPGRPSSDLFLPCTPSVKEFVPRPCLNPRPVELTFPEYEAVRLIDSEGLNQEAAAKRMKTSRGTIWRLTQTGRKKIVQALIESRPLIITPQGKVEKI
jgi:predicted DNA-binding protein (UPF0251 family)